MPFMQSLKGILSGKLRGILNRRSTSDVFIRGRTNHLYISSSQRINMIPNRIILAAVLIAAVVVSGCAQYGGNQTPPPSPPPSGQNAVAIQNFAFNPSALTVKAGTTVTWTNEDSVAHDVISDSGAFSSDSLSTGQTFSHTFDAAGTYEYHCGIHPSMRAKIIVEQ